MSTNHPIIPDTNQYLYEKQFVSIHSDDRDTFKYPAASFFEIVLPQDYCNVQAIKLHDWYISPTDICVFSASQQNTYLNFTVYLNVSDPTDGTVCSFVIEDGTYNSLQLSNELTNKFNYAVQEQTLNGAYSNFIVVFNQITQRFYFGNTSDPFTLNAVSTNGSYNPFMIALGLDGTTVVYQAEAVGPSANLFYLPATHAVWLSPGGYVVLAPNRANIAMESYIYMELAGMNGLDESMSGLPVTQCGNTTLTACSRFRQPMPNISSCASFSSYSGKVKSSFAKIPLTNPICDLAAYLPTAAPYAASGLALSATSTSMIKSFYPPLERVRKVGILLRYHNGQPVDFAANASFSITLELDMMRAQTIRPMNMYVPASSSFL